MTNVNTIPYHNSYGGCSHETSSLKIISKARKKAKKENMEIIFLITLLVLGNIIAICKSTTVSFGFFGWFLGGVVLVSLSGIVSGLVRGFFKRLIGVYRTV